MYCRNCGRKAENTDTFCIECGNRLRNDKKTPLINLKEMQKKYKKTLLGLFSILIILILYIGLNNYIFSEKAVIKRYIKAYVNSDYQTIIKLSGIKENEFINKKNINEKYNPKENNRIVIKNITDNVNKEEHVRTISYMVDGITKSTNVTIKSNGHKYLVFKSYIITSTDLIAENVSFIAPKNASIKIDNVELNEKFVKESNNNLVTYNIDSLLKRNTKFSIKLENGLELSDIKSVFNNEEVDYKELNYILLENNKSEDLANILKSSVTRVIESALKDEYDKIKEEKTFVETIFDDSQFSENYDKIKDKYKDSIKDFKVNNISIKNVKFDKDNNLITSSKIEYSYKDPEGNSQETSRIVSISLNDKLLVNNIQLNNLLYMFK